MVSTRKALSRNVDDPIHTGVAKWALDIANCSETPEKASVSRADTVTKSFLL